ncbi:MAG TPA: 1-acyl-sn-glycerol-3-phosphate acyltransferase [Polyangiaceae bacterium]|nr:1-acyl-sn-glycerol-3-phosphate acyltransferase [Polyangiaceae bacterium]
MTAGGKPPRRPSAKPRPKSRGEHGRRKRSKASAGKPQSPSERIARPKPTTPSPEEPITERRRERPRTLPAPGAEPALETPAVTAPAEPPRSEAPPRIPPPSAPPRSSPPSAPPRSSPAASELRALEERLSRATRTEDAEDESPPSIREQVSSAAREVVDRIAAPVSRVEEANVVDAVRDLLSSDYYLRQWGRLGMRNRSEEVDDFGFDPVYEARLRPLGDFLYERYFRVRTEGIENVPTTGRCLVVANHSGTLPLDGFMLRTAVRRELPAARELRWLAEDYVWHLPFVGAFMSRVGGVRACQENAERLLSKESLVAVFPEGVKGIGKLYRDRYKLQRFGRGGFVRLALRTRTPLVPCAVVGAEEASPMLHRDERISKLLGLPYLPVTPTFPFLGPLGLVPAPTKWTIRFGAPIRFDDLEVGTDSDPVVVGRLAEQVRKDIQGLLDGALASRKSVWFG